MKFEGGVPRHAVPAIGSTANDGWLRAIGSVGYCSADSDALILRRGDGCVA